MPRQTEAQLKEKGSLYICKYLLVSVIFVSDIFVSGDGFKTKV